MQRCLLFSFRLVKRLIPLSPELKFHSSNKLIDRCCNVATKKIKLKVNRYRVDRIRKETVFTSIQSVCYRCKSDRCICCVLPSWKQIDDGVDPKIKREDVLFSCLPAISAL